MKRTVNVTITKEFEIEIPDELLTPEKLAEFSSYMWLVSEPYELFQYAARHIALYDDAYLEGLGRPANALYSKPDEIGYKLQFEDVETEFVE